MQITFREHELAFSYDKNTKVKSIIPRGEYEFTVLFEYCNDESKQAVLEITSDPKVKVPECIPSEQVLTQKDVTPECGDGCPTVDDVVKYITSRDNYTYDNALVQEHFFGRVLDSRVEANLYHKLKDITNRAKDRIQEEENGKWKEKGIRHISKTRRAKQFTFVKPKTVPVQNILDKTEAWTPAKNGTIDVNNESNY